MIRCAFLVFGVLLAGPAFGASLVEDAARRAVTSGDFEEARSHYETLSRRHPEHVGHRIWIARLSSWLQDYERAEALYHDALREVPDHPEVLLGLARVATWSDRFDDAEVHLAEARVVLQNDPEVDTAARQNEYARAWYPVLQHRDDIEATVGYSYDDFSFASAGHRAFVRGAWHGTQVHPWGQLEQWDKFDESVTRLLGGVSAKPFPRWTIAGAVATAPGADVLAEFEFELSVGRSLPLGFGLGATYRQMHFSSSLVHLATGTVEYYFPFPVWLAVNVHHSWTEYDETDETESNDSISLRYHQQFGTRITGHLGYAFGTQTYEAVSIDRIGDFDAHTMHVGVDVVLMPDFTLRLGYRHENRDNGGEVNGTDVSISYFF